MFFTAALLCFHIQGGLSLGAGSDRDAAVSVQSTQPEISVIIVNYNAGEYLRPCVESLLTQTLTNFECILIDNGSTDGSLETLPELDERFTIVEAGENLGLLSPITGPRGRRQPIGLPYSTPTLLLVPIGWKKVWPRGAACPIQRWSAAPNIWRWSRSALTV